MASSALVTVISPVYNVERYLAETLEAVLAQTHQAIEYLVIDDGSTDATLQIARDAAARDPRVRVVQGAHAGSSAARNLGLRQARGDYVAFCDGDDRWLPTFLERSLEVLEAAPAEVGATFCAFDHIDEHGRAGAKTQRAEPGDDDAAATLAGHCPQGNGSCLLLRRSCFDEAGLFDEDLFNCVDFDMWMRIHLHASSPLFRFVPDVLVQWRTRPGAISSDESKRVAGLAEIFRRYDHVLAPEQVARAYTWPAVLGWYSGMDEEAADWTRRVRAADPHYYLRSQHGLVLGVFALVGPARGRALRAAARRATALLAQGRIALHQRLSRPAAGRSVPA